MSLIDLEKSKKNYEITFMIFPTININNFSLECF